MVGKIFPFFIVGKYSFLGTPKTPLLWCSVCRSSCYVRARSTGHFFSVRSLFNGKSSDKSKERSRSIPSSEKSKSISSNRLSKSGISKSKSKSRGDSFTASPPLQPVPHLFPFSTVLRQFFGVRSWFVRGSTPFCDSENTCLCRYKMEADRSGRFEHLPLTRHHALVVS